MPQPRPSRLLPMLLLALLAAVPAATAASQTAAGQPSTDRGDGLRPGTVRLASGVRLELVEAGPVDGAPVLFLHGYTDSWRSFAGVLERLPAGLRGLAPSQRGHGGSDRPDCCYRMDDLVGDAVALLDALGIERATVVGHSMGSFVAQRLAAEHPGRVDRLVLVGSGLHVAVPPVRELQAAVAALADPIPRGFVHEFQASTVDRPLPDEVLAGFVDESLRVPARVWKAALDGLVAAEGSVRWADVTAPTLLLGGARDAIWPAAEQEALHAAIRGSTLSIWPDAAHSPHWEHPDRFVDELAAFLGVPPRPRLAQPPPATVGSPTASQKSSS